jgi:UDPglucose 6-dehydrogenase
MTVAIIGMGVVGRAQAKLFGDVVTYDITDAGPYPEAAIAACDFAVIAVGTPEAFGGHADLTAVTAAVNQLPSGLPVLIRSTVPPGTMQQLRASSGRELIAHAPEFLTERDGGPWPESADVPFLILGGQPDARRFFRPQLARVFPGVIHECTALEAELAKYTANLAWATRVTFVNEMAAICDAAGSDWENVRAAWLCDPRVAPAYTAMAGFPPGFGGACWPKDLAALIAAAWDLGYEPEFLRAISRVNDRFRKDAG